jgi:hypothetical protein
VSRAVYVRRRLSVAVLAVGLVLVTAQAGAALGGSSPDVPGRAPTAEAHDTSASTAGGTATVVRPGDSLWSVAQRLAPDDDPRIVVDELRAARHDRPLLVGETVRWDG